MSQQPHTLPLSNPDLLKQQCLIKDGWHVASSEETLDVSNPFNGELIGTVPSLTTEDVNDAVAASHDAQIAWAAKTAQERATLLQKWADLIDANKEDLAQDLLRMLVDSFDTELTEMQQLIEVEDFPQLEHVLHRLYGATRYVGTPTLQRVAGEFEQFVSTLRKERRKADESFTRETNHRFNELNFAIEQVRQSANLILNLNDG